MKDGAASVLAALRRRVAVEVPVALVAAHPDDETIGAGASLHLFRNLVLVHVTDGAPGNGEDARRAGFTDLRDYAAARRGELTAALRHGGVDAELRPLGFPDQAASQNLVRGTQELAAILARHGSVCVVTHPYEGGHPDHDATACMVQAAGVATLEMTSYHTAGDAMACGCFLPNGEPPLVVTLSSAERARKRAMLDAFATQAATLSPFGVEREAFRRAPAYDFTQPPHPGTLYYERHPWGMTGRRWRELAAAA